MTWFTVQEINHRITVDVILEVVYSLSRNMCFLSFWSFQKTSGLWRFVWPSGCGRISRCSWLGWVDAQQMVLSICMIWQSKSLCIWFYIYIHNVQCTHYVYIYIHIHAYIHTYLPTYLQPTYVLSIIRYSFFPQPSISFIIPPTTSLAFSLKRRSKLVPNG